ncbi:MAG: T9SS type A sorting domain-containing protein [Flavobacteriales bacterium]|nr:T9SS type A sorting domain-containing protein [Flavobacteriales bacterium]
MTRFGRSLAFALLATATGPWTGVMGQDCLNETLYPASSITPNNFGQVTSIAANSYEEEYSQITGILAGAEYEFTISSGTYITVRKGTFDGEVVGQGMSPVTVLATSTDDLFAHWNADASCGTASNPFATTVQLLLDCTPATFTVDYAEDCGAGTFTILLDITNTGDLPTVDVIVELDGTPTITSDVGAGVLELGPFPNGSEPEVTVAHPSDPLCTIPAGVLAPFTSCPTTVDCSTGDLVQGEYCYANSETRTWLYQSSSAGTLRIEFFQGGIAFTDQFRVYSGQDNTAPLLFEHNTANTEDISGLVLYSSSGFLFIELISDGSTSCDDGGFEVDILVWEVGCGNCLLPEGTATLVSDCPTESFTVDVDITGLGDAPTATIVYSVNGGDPQDVIDLGLGVTSIGPFANGDSVAVVLQNGDSEFCEVDLGVFADPGLCPNLITCGAPAEELTYCYVPNDSRTWLFQSVGTGTLRLKFTRGTIESNTYDDIRIYDGADNTAPLLFEHVELNNYNLGPAGSAINNDFPRYYAIDVLGTGGSLFMEVGSDGSVQCGGEFPSATYDQWEWEVSCLDCDLLDVDHTIVDDCPNDQFSIPVEVISTGDGSIVNIVYTVNGGDPQTVINVGVGIADLGPFAESDTVNVVVEHENSALCNFELGDLTATGTCPILIDCGTELADSTCYGNNAQLGFYYQGTGTFPLGLFFDSGLLFFGDSLFVYDGGDFNAPVLFAGTDQNVTDLFVNTTNPDHLLAIRIVSNEFTSCEDGFEPEQLSWRVACLDCVPATVEFNIVEDCANFQYFVDVVISDLGTDAEAGIASTILPDTIFVTEPGTTQLGPFVAGTEQEITVLNDANSLCNVYSGNIVNPLCPTLIDCPGPTLEETYCYEPNDVKAWAYELVGPSGTLRLTFLRGTIESHTYEDLRIYDGADNTAPLLFEHTNFTTYNLGPAGSAVNNELTDFYAIDVGSTTGRLYMEMSSDGSVQCGGEFPSEIYDAWEWEVYCIDCNAPQASFNIIEDCVHREYSTEVIVTDEGDDAGLLLTNEVTGESIPDATVGVYTFGPYDVNDTMVFRVTNQEFEQCRAISDSLTLTSEECISVTCGSDNYEYCYGNNEDRWYTYRSEQNVPMTIAFLWGQLLAGDRIEVYNGADESVLPPLYTGNNGGNLTGFAINSQNTGNTITLRIVSDASGSCEDGGANPPLRWSVACGSVGVSEVPSNDFAVYPNPTEGLLQIEFGSKVTGAIQFRLLDMSGRVVLDQPLLMNGGTRNAVDLRGLQSGNYVVQLTTAKWVKTQRVQLAR